MAPNKDLAKLRAMMKKQVKFVGLGSGSQGEGTPVIDLENVQVATPVTRVPPQDLPQGTGERVMEDRLEPRQSARTSAQISADLAATQARKRKQLEAEKAKEKVVKKSKSSKSKHRSSSVSLDADFLAKNQEEYKVDPVGAAAKLFKHLADLKDFEMTEFKKKTTEELKRVEEKLEHTNNLLNIKAAQLVQAQEDLNNSIIAKDHFKNQADNAKVKIDELEKTVSGLETSKKELEGQVSVLNEQVSKLEEDLRNAKAQETGSSPIPSEASFKELERKLEESEKQRVEALELAKSLAKAGFDNAVEQIELVHPEIQVNKSLIRHDCEVDEGKIVFEDPVTEEKHVMFPLE